MTQKIPRIDSRMIEAWNRQNPKVGLDESRIKVEKKGIYGNYLLRNKLMELIVFLKDQYNVVVVPLRDQRDFKQRESEIIELAMDMVKML